MTGSRGSAQRLEPSISSDGAAGTEDIQSITIEGTACSLADATAHAQAVHDGMQGWSFFYFQLACAQGTAMMGRKKVLKVWTTYCIVPIQTRSPEAQRNSGFWQLAGHEGTSDLDWN